MKQSSWIPETQERVRKVGGLGVTVAESKGWTMGSGMGGEAITDKGRQGQEVNSGNCQTRLKPQPPLHSTHPTPHHYYAPRRAIAGIGTDLG